MEKSNTLEYLRLLNQSSKENIKVNNKNILDLLLDCIKFNEIQNSQKDKYLYIYNYINLFREYYDVMKEKIKNNYSKIKNKLNNNNQSLIENEIELIKYYRSKIFQKEIEDNTNIQSCINNNSKNEIKDLSDLNYLMEVYDNLDTYMDDMCNLYEETKINNKKKILQQVPNNDVIKLKNIKEESDILYVKNGNKRIKLNNNILFCNN